MDLIDITKDARITKVIPGSSAATTTAVNGTVLKMDGFQCIAFVFGGFWTSGAGHLMKAQKVASTTGSTPVDLSGASVTQLNGLAGAILNVTKPRDRYIRPTLIKAAVASAYHDVWAIQYNPRKRGANMHTTSDADSGLEVLSVISPST